MIIFGTDLEDRGYGFRLSLARLARRNDHQLAARRATAEVPSIPCDAEGPVFSRALGSASLRDDTRAARARGVHLAAMGATLGAEIKRAAGRGRPDTGETYYRHWLNALERLVAEKGVTDAATLARYQHAGPRG